MQDAMEIRLHNDVLSISFNRPEKHNALSLATYRRLIDLVEETRSGTSPAVVVFSGRGRRAFSSGTDAADLASLDATSGIEYERTVQRLIRSVQSLSSTTVASIQGVCAGGALALAAACDVRIVADSARFSLPVARSMGNCLSASTLRLLVDTLGYSITARLVLLADSMDAQEARLVGFAARLCADEDLEAVTDETVVALQSYAPLTLRATKAILNRLRDQQLPSDTDVLAAVYGSSDFLTGVNAFRSRLNPQWQGR